MNKKGSLILSFFGLCLWLIGCQPEPQLTGKTYILQHNHPMEITLQFDATNSQYFGKAVNRYFGKYHLHEKELTLESPASTMMMGTPSEMQLEDDYFRQLELVQQYQITRQTLTLFLNNGQTIMFRVQP